MNFLEKIWITWKQDRLLQSVIRNSGYLFSSNTISMILTAGQGILAAVTLGPSDWGLLGIVIVFSSSVNRLLSFRMGELVVKYGGQYLALGRKTDAAAVIKTAGLAEAITSVIAYILLVLLAPLASTYIIKNPLAYPLIDYYGVALLGNLMAETSAAVLQIGSHYRSQAMLNLVQSVVTALYILAAFVFHGGVSEVLTAYLAGKLIYGLGMMAAAFYWITSMLGKGWWKAPIGLLEHKREMALFGINTNLSGTLNMIIRDSEVLWVGYFCNTLQAGYYKFALAMMSVMLMPIAPFITTTFPEISRSVPLRQWQQLRRLLKRTTLIAAAWTGACAIGVLALGRPLLSLLKHGEYLPSYPAILILLVGYGIANILFWNRPLLLAFGNSRYPLRVNFFTGVVKTGLMFMLVPPFGYLVQAAILSGYLAVSVAVIVGRGLVELRQAEKVELAGEVV